MNMIEEELMKINSKNKRFASGLKDLSNIVESEKYFEQKKSETDLILE